MLDINFIRENAELVRDAVRKKGVHCDVDVLIKIDDERRSILKRVEEMRHFTNEMSEKIPAMEENEKNEAIAAMREKKNEQQKLEDELAAVKQKFLELMLDVPNIPDPSVPEGKSDADNVQIRTWGIIPEFSHEVLNHKKIMEDLKLIDTERGAKVSGARGYFLRGNGMLLEHALWNFSLHHLVSKDFIPVSAPALVRGRNLLGTGHFPQAKEDVYKVDEDVYLSGTSEIPLMGMHADEIIDLDDLPLKYVGFSPCYRREAGSYGKDTQGIFRVHEFFKVEQLVLIENDHQESVRWHEELTRNAEEILQALKLPYRVVVNSAGDIGRQHVKTHDIEVWIPSEKRYRESHSASYYHDFQTRRLNIRYRDAHGNMQFAHSLNNTVVATPRLLIAIVENYQNADGSVRVPDVLKQYINSEMIV